MSRGIRILVIVAALAIAASVAVTYGAPAGTAAAAAKPRIEVAFVLDSTGSMGGLIEGAKQKIWSMANGIISRKPTPEVKIGLITYRDRGDDYVTKLFDLTDDIDAVFSNLQSFRADGGGDDEESVNQALNEAVTKMGWSKDRSTLKIIFLVGDYPPHMDYARDIRYPAVCQDAVKRDIIVNTVQCGDVAETARVWQEIARLAEGSYVALQQSGGMQAVTTPYDEEIARLSAAISGTVVAYGSVEVQREAAAKSERAMAAPASVAADRAAFNLATGGKAIQGSGDLVNDIAEGTVDLAKLKDAELPAELRTLPVAQRRAYIEGQQAKRDELNKSIAELSVKRAAYIDAENRKLAGSGDSFDLKVEEIIAKEADRKLR